MDKRQYNRSRTIRIGITIMSTLLHPMFNSLSTRKKKKTKKTKEFLVAERKHDKYLKSMGLDKRTAPPPKSYGLTNDLRVQDDKPIHTMGTPCYNCLLYTSDAADE